MSRRPPGEEEPFHIGPSLPDGIWELTPRSGDTLNGLKIRISDVPPVAATYEAVVKPRGLGKVVACVDWLFGEGIEIDLDLTPLKTSRVD